MSELKDYAEDEYSETYDYKDMYEVIPYPKIFQPEDEEKEKFIDKILEWDRLLNKLQEKTGYKPRYSTYNYRSKNLYNFNKGELKKVLRNIFNQIYDLLAQMGYDPHNKPNLYTKYYPRKYGLKPAYAKYFVRKIAPFYVAQRLFPHFLNEVTLDELDIEFLHYLVANLSNLCSLELLKVEWLIENGKMKESEVVKAIRKDLLKRPDIEPGLRKEMEDEIFRYELSHKPEKQRLQLQKLYQQFCEGMKKKKEDEERQQEQILSDGLKRRKKLEELKQGKSIKRKETLGKSGAEALIEYHKKKKNR